MELPNSSVRNEKKVISDESRLVKLQIAQLEREERQAKALQKDAREHNARIQANSDKLDYEQKQRDREGPRGW